ncbi:hypothetical protein GCM10027598_84970 [Amycolatopsis oliviviridis]|uniref:Uncharacterized protein n=1 Tax=Amycolatopsis oliviviridis TaxID=1471590 RepID=A0ABQ3LDI6_9PSEU|nr:DUF6069 family protein [Amycolatopsis oliviviridis]GHH07766.1 hypothetical protein GCM10017790_14860 [Amycolatopsis oliviviridis]
MRTIHPTRPPALRIILALIAALTVNMVIALVAGSLDEGPATVGLDPTEYLPATVVGFLVGSLGLSLLARFAPRAPRVVVPVVLVLSWIPDLLLLNDGATAVNVTGLMIMHLVVGGAVVGAFARTIPDVAR